MSLVSSGNFSCTLHNFRILKCLTKEKANYGKTARICYCLITFFFLTYIRGTERGLQTIEENDKIEVQNTEQTKCRPQKLLKKGKERIIMGA